MALDEKEQDRPKMRPDPVFVFVAGLTVLALLLHVHALGRYPIWYDEGHTYSIVRDGLGHICANLLADAHPPVYFVIVALFMKLGVSEFLLRLPSALAATAVVPLIYAATGVLGAGRRASLIAAVLASISPILHYYSLEARPYALVVCLAALVLYAYGNLLNHPTSWPALLGFGAAMAALLNTHHYAVFLAPFPVLVSLTVNSRYRLLVFGRVTLAAFLAFATYLPWFVQATRAQSATAWIAAHWKLIPPALAIPRSLEVLGFAGRYPLYLESLQETPSLGVFAIVLTPLVLGIGVCRPTTEPASERLYDARVVLLSFLLGPLAVVFLYSCLWRPIFFLGRYEVISLPPLLILLALAIDRLLQSARLFGLGVLLAAIYGASGIAGLWYSSTAPGYPSPAEETAASKDELSATNPSRRWQRIIRDGVMFLKDRISPGDTVVFIDNSRPTVEFYLDRFGKECERRSFPRSARIHPWKLNWERLDPGQLSSEAKQLASELNNAARAGHTIWLCLPEFTHRPDGSVGHERDPAVLRALVSQLSNSLTWNDDRPDLGIASLRWHEHLKGKP